MKKKHIRCCLKVDSFSIKFSLEMKSSTILILPNQNGALLLMEISNFLISTNQNRSTMLMEFSTVIMSTNQN